MLSAERRLRRRSDCKASQKTLRFVRANDPASLHTMYKDDGATLGGHGDTVKLGLSLKKNNTRYPELPHFIISARAFDEFRK